MAKYEDNYIDPSVYRQQLNDLDNGISMLLDEFKKLYVISNMNPNDAEYQNYYQNVVNSLANVFIKISSISNEVKSNTVTLNKSLLELNEMIAQEREKNTELKRKLGIVENKNNAAYEMIYDYKNIYDKRYLRNWSLVLCSIIGIATIGIIYKKQPVV
jgi:hypothetical protein